MAVNESKNKLKKCKMKKYKKYFGLMRIKQKINSRRGMIYYH